MSDILAKLRSLTGIDDAGAARGREVSAERELTAGPRVHPLAVERMRALERRPESIRLGTAVLDGETPMLLPVERERSSGHMLITGATGAGKTALLTLAARNLVRRFAVDPHAPTIAFVDHKGDLANNARDVVASVAQDLPRPVAEALLDRFAVIDPFGPDTLAPFQILSGEADAEPAVLAYEVTSLLGRLAGDPFGSRQEAFTYLVLLDSRLVGRSLVALDALMADPANMRATMLRSPSPEVRGAFAVASPIGADALSGVRARLQRLLRLRSSRLMLGANGTVSLRECLASRILVIDLGSNVPLGCEDIGRFWSGFFTLKLIRSIFARSAAESRRPAFVFVDEWQEGLRSAGEIASDYERVLQMARSKGVSLVLGSQSLASAGAVSSSLPRVVATNAAIHVRFRASEEDAQSMRGMLPVTGRRFRRSDERRHDRAQPAFLSPEEERAALVAEAATLPDRSFYLWNRRESWPAQLARSDNLDLPARSRAPDWVRSRVERGCVARPIAELEEMLRGAPPPGGRFVPVGTDATAELSRGRRGRRRVP